MTDQDILGICKKVQRLSDEHTHTVRRIFEEKTALDDACAHVQDVSEAQQILQHVAETLQETAHTRIASIVTRCLEVIFEDDAYRFDISVARKRGKVEATLSLVDSAGHVLDPLGANGGGVVDVASLGLRLACLMMTGLRKIVILDEPFKFLHSEEWLARVGMLLETLSKELGVQFIMVTGLDSLRIGKVVEL